MPNLKVDKPWGYEIILTDKNSPYTAKIIFIKAGCQLSLQYHDQKQETITLTSGQAILIKGSNQNNLETISLTIYTGHTINPNIIHRIKAITDTLIFEASTPETGTTFRLEDDYNRPNETDQVRNSSRN